MFSRFINFMANFFWTLTLGMIKTFTEIIKNKLTSWITFIFTRSLNLKNSVFLMGLEPFSKISYFKPLKDQTFKTWNLVWLNGINKDVLNNRQNLSAETAVHLKKAINHPGILRVFETLKGKKIYALNIITSHPRYPHQPFIEVSRDVKDLKQKNFIYQVGYLISQNVIEKFNLTLIKKEQCPNQQDEVEAIVTKDVQNSKPSELVADNPVLNDPFEHLDPISMHRLFGTPEDSYSNNDNI